MANATVDFLLDELRVAARENLDVSQQLDDAVKTLNALKYRKELSDTHVHMAQVDLINAVKQTET